MIKCNFIEEKNDKYFLKGCFTKDKFLKRFLRKIVNEKIIDRGKIKSIEKSIFISNSVIKLEYSGMRNFLLEEQVFKYNNDNIENELLFEISQKYNYIFKTNDDIMTLESLNKILELEKKQGMLAEEFVLQYEIKRLGNDYINKIKKVSEENVMLGYDIVSVKSQDDLEEIYIEVKSYSGDKLFLTSNEIEVACKFKEKYYLYIVDFSNINQDGYEPHIIKNPYYEIINNKNINKKIELLSIQIDEI